MKISIIRLGAMLGAVMLFGAFIGAFSVFLTNPSIALKPVKSVAGLVGTNAEFLNNSSGVKIGSFAVYHSPGKNEALSISASHDSYPVILVRKTGANQVDVSISDKEQNILKGNLKNQKFELTSYLNVGEEGLNVTNIDMDADGTCDLIAKQTKSSSEAKFLFEGQWYPYRGENGKWMIETADGWREIVKSSNGFTFR